MESVHGRARCVVRRKGGAAALPRHRQRHAGKREARR
jgi:hypothetical protein